MRLIYTYNSKVNTDPASQRVYRDLYTTSIIKSRELDYITEIYSDVDWFSPYVDKWYNVEEEDNILWDSFKFIPLKSNEKDFVLIDGDLILHNKLNLSTKYDLIFDAYEKNNWNLLYKDTVVLLYELGISEFIPEWDITPLKVFNCGLLKINNTKLKKLYYNSWHSFLNFVKLHREKIDPYNATAVGAQFLLTLLVKKHNYSYINYSKELGTPNKSYIHLAGKNKLNITNSVI